MPKSVASRANDDAPADLSERLLFSIWLAGKKLGVENSKQFAAEIRKGATQLSRWVSGEQRPSWESIKLVADAIGIDPVWLDDPSRHGAEEPPDFAEWLAARRARQRAANPKAKRA